MALNIDSILGNSGILSQVGFYRVFLPILLMLVIFYGILELIHIFGDDSRGKKINVIISIVLTLFITYSTSYLAWFATTLSALSGYLAIILVGLLFLYIIWGMISNGNQPLAALAGGKWGKWILFIICGVIIFFLFRGANGLTIFGANIHLPHVAISAQTIFLIIMIGGLIALTVWAFLDTDELRKKRAQRKAARQAAAKGG